MAVRPAPWHDMMYVMYVMPCFRLSSHDMRLWGHHASANTPSIACKHAIYHRASDRLWRRAHGRCARGPWGTRRRPKAAQHTRPPYGWSRRCCPLSHVCCVIVCAMHIKAASTRDAHEACSRSCCTLMLLHRLALSWWHARWVPAAAALAASLRRHSPYDTMPQAEDKRSTRCGAQLVATQLPQSCHTVDT